MPKVEEKIKIPPSADDVRAVVNKVFGEDVTRLERFATGNCHFVFDVDLESTRNVVVRLAWPQNRHLVTAALYWHRLVKPLGVPVADILASDRDAPYPFLILERLPGTDLNLVYRRLSGADKMSLAVQINRIQNMVSTLPEARGFGYLSSYETDSFCDTWVELLETSLERSRSRIVASGIFASRVVDRVAGKIRKYEDYFSNIAPTAFLDDITTKNVIMDGSTLSGVVDIDCVCFGDSLLTVALTRMSLLLSGNDLDYVDYWCREMNIGNEQKTILDVYTAIFCVDFMSEFGKTFNKDDALAVDNKQFERLHLILENLLAVI